MGYDFGVLTAWGARDYEIFPKTGYVLGVWTVWVPRIMKFSLKQGMFFQSGPLRGPGIVRFPQNRVCFQSPVFPKNRVRVRTPELHTPVWNLMVLQWGEVYDRTQMPVFQHQEERAEEPLISSLWTGSTALLHRSMSTAVCKSLGVFLVLNDRGFWVSGG